MNNNIWILKKSLTRVCYATAEKPKSSIVLDKVRCENGLNNMFQIMLYIKNCNMLKEQSVYFIILNTDSY